MLVGTASISFMFHCWASKIMQVQQLSYYIHDYLTVTKRLKHTSGWPQQRQLLVGESIPQVTSCKPSTAIIFAKQIGGRAQQGHHPGVSEGPSITQQPCVLMIFYDILMISTTIDDTFGERRKLPGTNPIPCKHIRQRIINRTPQHNEDEMFAS